MKQNKKILDYLMALTKAGIAAVPIWGGPIVSLINDYVPTARQKSLEEAFRLLKHKLESIEDRIDVEAVKKDEFAELYNSCLLIIVRTRQMLKLNAAVSLVQHLAQRRRSRKTFLYRT